ncbi:MAG: NAD(P)-dependent oxidoreductase [Adhaeribacter sp.]|nr:NAD(P)-dependent oxidoreductase [Adhaeribacter sp.]
MKILITGANGFVGAALCRYFHQQGHTILALGRQSKPHPNLAAIADYLPADITQTLKPFRADVCIHAAALASDTAAYKDLYHNNVKGTCQVLRAARHCAYFVQVSSSSVYQFGKAPAKESDATLNANLSPYGRTKLIAEQLVLENIPTSQKRIILRPRAIYGIGDRVLLPRLLHLVKGNIIFCPVPATVQTSLTYIGNIGYAIDLFLQQIKPPRMQIYNIADAPAYNLRKSILQLLTAIYPPDAAYCQVPIFLLKLLGGINKMVPFSARLNPFVLHSLTQNALLDTGTSKAGLGYEPQYNFEDTYPQIAAWLQQLGGPDWYLKNLTQAPWELGQKFANIPL